MTIKEAIEIKQAYHNRFSKHMLSKERDADQLSIEGLKRLKDLRVDKVFRAGILLPGETVN